MNTSSAEKFSGEKVFQEFELRVSALANYQKRLAGSAGAG
jgi:two-component sensor histidine kinase